MQTRKIQHEILPALDKFLPTACFRHHRAPTTQVVAGVVTLEMGGRVTLELMLDTAGGGVMGPQQYTGLPASTFRAGFLGRPHSWSGLSPLRLGPPELSCLNSQV